jgi:hypothetical protein
MNMNAGYKSIYPTSGISVPANYLIGNIWRPAEAGCRISGVHWPDLIL